MTKELLRISYSESADTAMREALDRVTRHLQKTKSRWVWVEMGAFPEGLLAHQPLKPRPHGSCSSCGRKAQPGECYLKDERNRLYCSTSCAVRTIILEVVINQNVGMPPGSWIKDNIGGHFEVFGFKLKGSQKQLNAALQQRLTERR